MPVYKQKPEFLTAALQSVLNQEWNQFRLVIVIDGAPEMEPQIRAIVGTDPRVELLHHEHNKGVAATLNTGFARLYEDHDIEYLTWVSSDNIYGPRFLDVLRQALVEGPEELGLVYSCFEPMDNDNKHLYSELDLSALRQFQGQPKDALLDSSIVAVSFMYKSRYAQLTRGYDLIPVEDYDYWLQLTDHCEIKFIPTELMEYRVDSTFSVSAQLKSVEKQRHWRYTYHLARHQARTRRHIAPEITILFPVSVGDQNAINRIENLYNQSFSNYVCYVLDLSPTKQGIEVLSQVPHPLTDFQHHPNVDIASAVKIAASQVTTPYTMWIGPNDFPTVVDLQMLYDNLCKQDPSVWSNYFAPVDFGINYRWQLMTERPDWVNELFRTPHLIQYLNYKTIENE
ncbi:glycosyltransferase [Paenibacillus pini]|uniref:Glycosyl transferase n=1 Tax=Paenibacillus pini JCM 16418 TaxID=1236976 RepID=W7Z553_9BACL|nr:glycosyltransferase [Paenibacillus pini]GAF09459.1 glycosyl transferase [Paenibacillus pini JCM 16418]